MVLGLFEPTDPDQVSVLVETPPSVGGLLGGTVSLNQLFGKGDEFRFWSDIEIRDAIDSYSTVSFTAPFEAERQEFREVFRPFTFKPLQVKVGGEDFFSGTMVGIFPEVTPESRSVKVDGYALPGVLQDTTEPASRVPLEFNKVTLRDIAEQLAKPYGIDVEFRESPGATIDKATLEVDQSPQELLAELAKQRNLIISNTAAGAVLFWRSITAGNPVARLRQGQSPVGSVSPSFSPQSYFSEITGFAKAKNGRPGSQYTAQNPFLDAVLRPHSFQVDDAAPAETPDAVRAKLGRMFANMASWVVDGIPGWRDPQGKLFRPNTTITLIAPDAMIYRETELLIRAVNYRQDAEEKSCSLELVLPGSFSGETPSQLPWDE